MGHGGGRKIRLARYKFAARTDTLSCSWPELIQSGAPSAQPRVRVSFERKIKEIDSAKSRNLSITTIVDKILNVQFPSYDLYFNNLEEKEDYER